MKKSWVMPLGLLIIVISFFYIIVPFTSETSFGSASTPKDFPLSQKWMTKIQGNGQQITIVDNHMVIIRTMSEIYALDIQSGDIYWQQGTQWHFSYQPVFVKNGKLFLTDGKGILALNQSDGKIIWQQSVRHPSGAEVLDVTEGLIVVNDPPYLAVYNVNDGALQWEKEVCREPVRAYFFDTSVVVPCYGLSAIDAYSGQIIWEAESHDDLDRIWKSAFADGVIYFSQDLENVIAYDVKNRKLLWKTPLADDYDSFQAYKVMGDHLFVTIDDQLCVLHREDGRYLWCTDDLVKPQNPTSLEGFLYLLNGLRKGVTAYDLHDGSQAGRLDFPAYTFITAENDKQLMVASEKLLVFANKNRIYAYGE